MQVQIVRAFGWLAGADSKSASLGHPLRYRNSRDKSPFSPVAMVQQQAEHPPTATVRRTAERRCYLIMVTGYLSQFVHNRPMHPYLLDQPHLRPQPDLFDTDRWPRRPYCTNDFEEGVRIRSLKQALTKAYIQVNPPHLRVWSIYDIDRPGGSLAWEDANLPPPSWITSNRENRHAHIVYGLSAPVLVNSMEAKQAPLRFLSAIEQSFRVRLGADDGYSGLLTKNPAHPLWETFQGKVLGYNLHDLANCIEDLDRYKADPGVKVAEVGLGRNVTVFDFVRLWSYKKVRDFKHTQGGFVYWQKAVLDRCGARNGDFARPMDSREIYHIARSVARWTWQRFDIAASDARFSKLQSYRRSQRASKVTQAQIDEELLWQPNTK